MDVLGALNTGHQGAATLHANSARDVPARLAALAALAGADAAALAVQALAGLDAAVHLGRVDGRRRVMEIAAFRLDDVGRLQCVPAITSDPAGAVGRGAAWGQLAARCGW